MSGNMTVYVRVDDEDLWLVYTHKFQQWQVKTTAGKRKDLSLAYSVVPTTSLPQDCPAGKWLICDDFKFGPQRAVTISVVTQEEADTHRAEEEREAGHVVKCSRHVRITGATGDCAGRINGVYKPTEEMCGNVTVYAKVGEDCNTWLVYIATTKSWNVQVTEHKGTGRNTAFCRVPAKCLPQSCPMSQWRVAPGSVLQPAVTITVVTQEEADAYLAEVEREAARVVKGIEHVRITGATGPKADYINGEYKPTEEMSGNVTVYVMVEDGTKWLEYNASIKQWQVKETEHKGTNLAWATCDVPVKCLPEHCPSGKWRVAASASSPFVLQPAITIKQKKRVR